MFIYIYNILDILDILILAEALYDMDYNKGWFSLALKPEEGCFFELLKCWSCRSDAKSGPKSLDLEVRSLTSRCGISIILQ